MKVSENPLVSIKCTVYNHEPYLRQCLDGFVMQKTNFAFEAIVHDDASTDGSAAIIREYAEKYPDIIKPIYETENQYSKKNASIFKIMNAAIHPDAKYVAICEGDDYWTDPYKLQKQFDFMEEHDEYSLCFHAAEEIIEGDTKGTIDKAEMGVVEERDYMGYEIIANWIVPTASTFFRRSIYQYPKYLERIYSGKYLYGDIILFLSLAEIGKIRCISAKPMSVYRRHSGGVTLILRNQWEKKITHLENLRKDFNGLYKKYIDKELGWMYFDLFTSSIKTEPIKALRALIMSFIRNHNKCLKMMYSLLRAHSL